MTEPVRPSPLARRLFGVLCLVVVLNYLVWAYLFWSSEGEPVPSLVAACLAVACAAAATWRWPRRGAQILALLGAVLWVVYARAAAANADAGSSLVPALLIVTVFCLPTWILAALSWRAGRARG